MKKERLMRGMIILLILVINVPAIGLAQSKPSLGYGSSACGVAASFGQNEIIVGEIASTFGQEIKVGEIEASFN